MVVRLLDTGDDTCGGNCRVSQRVRPRIQLVQDVDNGFVYGVVQNQAIAVKLVVLGHRLQIGILGGAGLRWRRPIVRTRHDCEEIVDMKLCKQVVEVEVVSKEGATRVSDVT